MGLRLRCEPRSMASRRVASTLIPRQTKSDHQEAYEALLPGAEAAISALRPKRCRVDR